MFGIGARARTRMSYKEWISSGNRRNPGIQGYSFLTNINLFSKTEDGQEVTNSTYNTFLDEPDEQRLQLKDEEVEELMNLEIPQRWGFEIKDQALRQKYRHAIYFQRFGDIPQVRYVVEFEQMSRGGIITLELAKQLVCREAGL